MTGANGLVGSVFVRDFANHYDITNLDLSGTPSVDITNADQIDEILGSHPATAIIHCAAFTDVTAAWQQTGDTTGVAYKVNVQGTENIVRACKKHNKKLIHLSTAYVFSGESDESYVEEAPTGPVEWYGQTKLLAEQVIAQALDNWAVLRIDNPFRRDTFIKPDVVRRTIEKLRAGALPPQFSDAQFGPTVIEDVAKVIDWVVRTNAKGIFHATAGESWTPYAFAQAVAKKLDMDPDVVKEGSLTQYLKTSERPYPRNTALDCSKLKQAIDFQLQTVQAALDSIIL